VAQKLDPTFALSSMPRATDMVPERVSMHLPKVVAILATIMPSLAACVSKGQYDAAVADAQQARARLEATEKGCETEEVSLKQQLTEAEQKSQDLDQKLSDFDRRSQPSGETRREYGDRRAAPSRAREVGEERRLDAPGEGPGEGDSLAGAGRRQDPP
jgi:hypothetical protein